MNGRVASSSPTSGASFTAQGFYTSRSATLPAMTRVLILLGITALACRDKESPKPATPGSAATATPAAPTAPHAVRADKAPELLPSFGSGVSAANVAERFDHEDVDTAWKSRTE